MIESDLAGVIAEPVDEMEKVNNLKTIHAADNKTTPINQHGNISYTREDVNSNHNETTDNTLRMETKHNQENNDMIIHGQPELAINNTSEG